jgi:hypothetical protein
VKVKINKELISDNGKVFRIGSDIAFDYEGYHYIAEIADIGETSFTGIKIVINKKDVVGVMWFLFDKIENCNYVSYD